MICTDYTGHYAVNHILQLCGIVSDCVVFFFFFSSRRRHTRSDRDWSSDVCSSDLAWCHLEGLVFEPAPLLGMELNRRGDDASPVGADGLPDAASDVPELAAKEQIGRASCRERV